VCDLPQRTRGLKLLNRGRIVVMGWSPSGISFAAHRRLVLVIVM
jgi:hypothetical protein